MITGKQMAAKWRPAEALTALAKDQAARKSTSVKGKVSFICRWRQSQSQSKSKSKFCGNGQAPKPKD